MEASRMRNRGERKSTERHLGLKVRLEEQCLWVREEGGGRWDAARTRGED